MEAISSRAANQATTVAVETTTADMAATAAVARKENTHTGKSNIKNLRGSSGRMAVIAATMGSNANSTLRDIIRMQ